MFLIKIKQWCKYWSQH